MKARGRINRQLRPKRRAVSDEFWDVCMGLNQDAEYLYGPTVDDWIIGALGLVRDRRYGELRDYLDHILRTESDEGLRELYDSTWRDVGFGDIRGFLIRVRDIIDTKPWSSFGSAGRRVAGR